MTRRLYYDDSYACEFQASVVRVEPRDGRLAVWLDRSAFYPTTGGQPFDTGNLGSARVLDVFEDGGGDVIHLVDGAPDLREGGDVRGLVDWPRRFDHMQQHTGQHVLSAACVAMHAAKTVSFHLGADLSTIDLDRALTPADIARVESEANRVVWEDRPVTVRYASAEDAAAMRLRKASEREGTLRLIDVEHFDLSACGGTHVRRTGAIGVVVVSGWERFKGGQRIAFACGGRAASRFRLLRDAVDAGGRLLSALPDALAGSIERLQEDARDQKRTIGALRSELARYRAAELAAGGEPHAFGRLVLQSVDGDAAELKALALALAAQPGVLAVLLSRSSPSLVVAARSADLAVSCDELVETLIRTFGGRGGGKPNLAQGGGLIGPPDHLSQAVRRLLSIP